ncbi:DNA alkylation repair protein [Corynebacterium epidermidicanis]|uniref:Putative DNA alkylation repair enzyme n=1 Tax=Corynebacterium epidermidicanis TaxID=1050174 RepID=A0A0G3GNE2_9CORY|nr:DNA alkylation repair protein [Corynebacterium epidermidicanis]AKK02634.1 putative DNA alkylation repair enzyme [Corynebacterium epidermidicanis]
MAPTESFLTELRAGFQRFADPERAKGQQAYLKTLEPMLGITNGDLRSVVNAVSLELLGRRPGLADLLAVTEYTWAHAQSRDERSAAIFLLALPRYARLVTFDAMPLIRQLVVEGAWWDLVDALVKVQPYARASAPAESDALMRAWAVDENFWIRRYAIISQLGTKSDLDKDLLVDCILPNLADREFFVAKAIGWALRDHARHDPEWVRAFVALHERRMQPLSRREALKHL